MVLSPFNPFSKTPNKFLCHEIQNLLRMWLFLVFLNFIDATFSGLFFCVPSFSYHEHLHIPKFARKSFTSSMFFCHAECYVIHTHTNTHRKKKVLDSSCAWSLTIIYLVCRLNWLLHLTRIHLN